MNNGNRITHKVNGSDSAQGLLQKHLPPHDVYHEQLALGCILREFDKIDTVAGVLTPEMFYLELHQLAYAELVKWSSRNEPFEPHRFAKFIEKAHPQADGVWDRLLTECYESVPHGWHAKYEAGIVRDKWVARQSIYVATELIRSAHEAVDFPQDLASHIASLQRLGESGEGSDGISIQSGLLELMDRWETGRKVGLATGFDEFDKVLRLLPAGVYVLAGRPGQGKSAFALAILEYVSRTLGVLLFTMEMRRVEVLARLVSRVVEIPAERIEEMVLEGKAPEKLTDAMQGLAQRTFIIDDRDHLTIDQMAATARVHARKQKLGLIAIDYCQLITPRDRRVNREQQIAEISRSIKQLANQVDLPILLLSQMSREVEKREGRWPQLSDLRESGAIENDADGVIFIHDENPTNETYRRTLVVRKNRNGRNDVNCAVEWLPQFTTFKPIRPKWDDAEHHNPMGDD